jgi:hypothetical protein
MAKHNALHPGVQVYLKGSSFCVRFKQNGYDTRKGLGTADAKIADEWATLIFKILHGEPYDYKSVPEPVRKALVLQDPVKREQEDQAIRAGEALPPESSLDDESEGQTPEEQAALAHGITLFEKLEEERGKNNELTDEIKKLNDEVHALRKKVTALEAMLVAGGLSQLRKVKPKMLKDAIADYIATGTGAGERAKKEYRNYLNQFKKEVGDEKLISEIEPTEIITYLQDLKIEYVPTIQKITFIVCAMLDNQSAGTYPTHPIKEWKRKHLKTDGKTDDDFYWIAESDVKKLAEQAKKDTGDAGQYWSDVILAQFGLALRPEELAIIQGKETDLTKKTLHICPIIQKDGKKEIVVRRLKTAGSKATLNFPSSLLEVMQRRKKDESLVLFKRDVKELDLRKENRGTPFESRHSLWKPIAFCKHYLTILRNAAKKLKLDHTRIDCRTLRRSRGRDIILKLQSAEKAASFLRDNPETVRKHYSRWLPKDISAE